MARGWKEGAHRARELGVVGEEKADAVGEGEDVLAHGDVGQDAVDEMGGVLGHAPCAPGWAEPPSLAAECDQLFIVAGFAPNPEKAMLKPPAFQVFVKLVCHICR